MKTTAVNFFLLGLLAGCGGTGEECYPRGHYANVTNYSIQPYKTTPGGIQVDGETDLNEIDRKVGAVMSCLRAKYPDGKLPREVLTPGNCLSDTIQLDIPACLVIKVAPDWHASCVDPSMQVFPCSVDPNVCRAKGIEPTDACPCECRSAIQDNGVIVVTPDLRLLAHDLIRLQTTCNFIWIPGLDECYQ